MQGGFSNTPLLRSVERPIEHLARQRMTEVPVVVLHGPRAVGKTTLLRSIAAAHGAEVVDLDPLSTRQAAAADPARFVAGPGPVFIDEYQHAPLLLGAIEAELRRDGSPGRFVIAGSARHDSLPAAAHALAGRLHPMTVYPLSQSELAGGDRNLVRTLFDDPGAGVSARPSETSRAEYVARVTAGGFPQVLRRTTSRARGHWFNGHLRLCLERDVGDLARIQQRPALPRLLALLAAQTGQVLNIAAAGKATDLDKRTADNYTKLLEALFLIQRLPAWGTTLPARAVALPKLHVIDSGLAARLLRLTPERLAQPNATALRQFDQLLETFVVGEVRAQASWMDGIAGLGHWRTHDGAEVDMVVERDDGSVVALVVKAGTEVVGKDLSGLRAIRDALGDAFVAGAVLHTGNHSYTAEDRIHALPVDRLWS